VADGPGLSTIRQRLRASADPSRVPVLQRFFQTGPGQYAEGDRFIGVTVPDVRKVCRACRGASLDDVAALLASPVHEERLLALLLLVDRFATARIASAAASTASTSRTPRRSTTGISSTARRRRSSAPGCRTARARR
jgi:hypothetical protein